MVCTYIYDFMPPLSVFGYSMKRENGTIVSKKKPEVISSEHPKWLGHCSLDNVWRYEIADTIKHDLWSNNSSRSRSNQIQTNFSIKQLHYILAWLITHWHHLTVWWNRFWLGNPWTVKSSTLKWFATTQLTEKSALLHFPCFIQKIKSKEENVHISSSTNEHR